MQMQIETEVKIEIEIEGKRWKVEGGEKVEVWRIGRWHLVALAHKALGG